jgi:hypothetical protein
MHCVRMWLARADCSKLCKKKKRKKKGCILTKQKKTLVCVEFLNMLCL